MDDRDFNNFGKQEQEAFAAFHKPKTMLEVSVETGILRPIFAGTCLAGKNRTK